MTESAPDAVRRLALQAGEPFLGHHHVDGARRLAALCERSRLRQRVTMSYDSTRTGPSRDRPAQADLADSAADARAQLTRLARRISGDCWDVLMDVCAFDKGLQQLETERNWPRRSAKLVLRIGLDQVCAAWGIGAEAEGRASTRLATWRAERLPMFPDEPN